MPAIVKKILWTSQPANTPGKVDPGMNVRKMNIITNVPMLAGRNPFSATPIA